MNRSRKDLFGPSSMLTNNKRQYAAAKVSRTTGDWIPCNQDVNSLIRSSSPILKSRIRQLVRDFPYFERAANILVDYTVGTGMSFQSRVLNANWKPGTSEKKFDRVVCQQIEDAVSWAMDEMDASGRLHFCEMERLSNRQDVESGEYLFVKTILPDKKRFIPYALMAYEADWLTSSFAEVAKNNEVDQGIEFNPLTGQIIAYHFAVPSGYGFSMTSSTRTTRVLAEHVIHDFETKRPGQLRGVSPFTTAVLIAHDLGDYLDATIDTAKLAAKYLAIVETPDIAGFQGLRTTSGTGADAGKKIEHLDNAIIEYLRSGEKITFAKNDTPGTTFDPFTKFVLHMLAVATGTPYSLLSGNYGDYSYTSLRGERQDVYKCFRPRQQRHIRHLTSPVIRDVIDWSVLSGRLNLPGYWQNQRAYWRSLIIPPGNEPIDPLRESKANRDDMAAGLQSPQEIVQRRGRDLEEVYDEIAEAQEMAAERGIVFDVNFDTSLANNPAALGATEQDTNTKTAKVVNLRRAVSRAMEDALLLMEGDK